MGVDYKITVLPAGVSFECSADETILEAATRRGLALPYGCRKGNCGTCKAQLLEGEVDLETESAYSLSDFERDQGLTLLCSAYPLCDTTVEMEGLDASELEEDLPPPVDFLGQVIAVEPLTHDIYSLELALDRPLAFRAGMFAQVNVPGTDCWRSYSMANPPSQPDQLSFILKIVPGGLFSQYIPSITAGEKLRLRAPFGSFWIRDHNRPLLMIGGGAGMAPLLSMLEQLAEAQDQRQVRFFYGARTLADLFYLDRIHGFGDRLRDFEFVSSLSHAGEGEPGGHEFGLVTDVVDRRIGSEVQHYDAYLCGPPPMIDAALRLLEECGLRERANIYYDKFAAS